MSSESGSPLLLASPERRLHWLSLFIGFGREVRRLVVLIVVSLFAARGQSGDERFSFTFILIGLTTLSAIARYFSFRYRYDANELVIRSGIIFRNERHIPYDRIQNIDGVANVVERMFGVVSVQVQTGGGKAPEAEFRVLPLSALDEMRDRVFGARESRVGASELASVGEGPSTMPRAVPVADPGVVPVAARNATRPLPPIFAPSLGTTLLHLAPRELLICGFIENRAAAVFLSILILLEQVSRGKGVVEQRLGQLAGGLNGSGVVLIIAGVLLLLLLIRLASTVWELVRLHDFRLSRHGDDLRTEYGMFTRVTATIPVRRIQAITIQETLLHRWLGRAAIRVTTAGGGTGHTGRHERELLAPIIDREAVASLLHELQPGADLVNVPWHRAHPRAFARILRRWSLVTAVVVVASAPFIHWWAALIAVALLGAGVVRGRLMISNLAWGPLHDGVVFRTGWIRHTTMLTRFARVQAVELDESPIDRWTGMAEVSVDTAGGLRAARLRMPFLARADARELRDLVAVSSARTEFVW